ncbi:MAG: NAD(P)H-dependent glycerol-3-phosphate dehydrogenase [Planctomycetota bacterium]
MATRFTVIGDGAMGTACALLLAKNPEQHVTLWCQFEANAADMLAHRENRKFLPGVAIPEKVRITADFQTARDAAAFVLAVPTVYVGPTLETLKAAWPTGSPVISVIKGIERETFRTPSQIIEGVLGHQPVIVLSGPSHAEEIAREKPASVVASSGDLRLARQVQQWFSTDRFRVYTTPDLRGTELGGALKNVIAIAAGICDGLEFGDNAKSALVTRGLVEMVRLGKFLGAEEETFYGLAGLGDLITTCMSRHSRNRRVGDQLGRGMTLDEILASSPQVAEGVWTSRSVHDLSLKHRIEMPVSEEVYQILFEKKNPLKAVADLMTRELKPERST